MFLTAAAALGYRRGIADLVGGMCETDFSGYPDCRNDTMEAMAKALSLGLAREVEAMLRKKPDEIFDHMYGDEPDRWDDDLKGTDRLRFTINVLTRLRVCTADGTVDLKMKGKAPPSSSDYQPWFDAKDRLSRYARVIFGHWSALGFVKRNGVVGLDSGCVWGGALTAYDLDSEHAPIAVKCKGYQLPDD